MDNRNDAEDFDGIREFAVVCTDLHACMAPFFSLAQARMVAARLNESGECSYKVVAFANSGGIEQAIGPEATARIRKSVGLEPGQPSEREITRQRLAKRIIDQN